MATKTITVAGQQVTLVSLPEAPGFRSVEFELFDAIGSVAFPFSGTSQTQEWMGADRLSGTATLPPLAPQYQGAWKAWLMAMAGMKNAVLVGDPMAQQPQGDVGDGSAPVVDGSDATKNTAGTKLLYTKGWAASVARALLPYDAIQVGYRLHYMTDVVATDSNGNAVLPIWPSLREQPVDEAQVILNAPKGLFRLQKNQRGWSDELRNGTRISFPLTEFR